MSDLAFELLRQRIHHYNDESRLNLWVADENIGSNEIAKVSPANTLHVVCNRYDTCQMLKEQGFNGVLNDFDFSFVPGQHFDEIYYRVSKEKAIVHHVINNAGRYLKTNGRLLISGYKNEGIKTYIGKASDYLGECYDREHGGKTSQLAVIEYQNKTSALVKSALDDKNYPALRLINPQDPIAFISKPGLFGWNKIDQGSAFLVEHLPPFIHRCLQPPKRVVDLGCGYGYLSVMASQWLNTEFIATDNNVAAVNACRENFKRHDVNGTVVLADCADTIEGPVDTVICNPPFHQGFAIDSDLTFKFLMACQRLLVSGGCALFVVNSFIPLERKATSLFSAVNVINNNKRFKLIELIK